MNKAFFDAVRSLFGPLTQGQVDGFNTISREISIHPMLVGDAAYILATAWHETATTMQPIEEIGHGAGHPYGLPTGPWHRIYDGNGDVQLTFEANYRKATERLRAHGVIDATVDLERNPELARDPEIAASILVLGMLEGWFTGKKLSDFPDFINKRRVVNGTDRADLIAHYAIKFEHTLQAGSWTSALVAQPEILPPASKVLPSVAPASAAAATPQAPPVFSTGGRAPLPNPLPRIMAAIMMLIGAFTVWYTSH